MKNKKDLWWIWNILIGYAIMFTLLFAIILAGGYSICRQEKEGIKSCSQR